MEDNLVDKNQKFLGVDIGTTNISMEIIDGNGNVIYSNVFSNSFFGNAIHTQNAEELCSFCIDIIYKLYDKYAFSAIGISNQMHGILYIDKEGNAISDLYTWQDERGNELFDKSTYVAKMNEITKSNLASGYGSVSLFFDLINNLVPKNAHKICTIGDYLAMKLSNNKEPIMHESNAHSLGLYDILKHRWEYENIELLNIDVNYYPKVVKKVEKIGKNSLGFCVYTAIGDNQASVYGVTNDINSMVINVGTGSQITMITNHFPKISDECEVRPYIDGNYIIIGSILSGGYSYNLLKNFFDEIAKFSGGKFDYEIMNSWALSTLNDSSLSVIPKFKGTRKNPKLKGVIKNIDDSNFTPQNLTRAFIVGMGEELYHYYRKLKKVYGTPKYIIGAGNGIRLNKALKEYVSNRFKINLLIPREKEEAAFGVALLVAEKECKNSLKKYIKYE